VRVPKGATLELTCGGGGGWGPPAERDPEAVHSDIAEGYTTEAHARRHYPHAFDN
jgi:N-methylhydantoinase B